MDALSPPRLPVAIVVLGALTLLCATRLRELRYELRGANEYYGTTLAGASVVARRQPDYELRGEGAIGDYGTSLAADGSVALTTDRTGRGVVLHFDRVVDGEVNPEARISLGRYALDPSVAVRGDLAVANVELREGRQLRFYAYENRTWSEVHRITMQELCSNGIANDIHLGDDLMVVEAGDVWCVWERVAGRWTFSRTVGHEASANVRVSKNRILIQSSTGVEQVIRTQTTWTRTRIVKAERGHDFVDIAASSGWLLVTTHYDRRNKSSLLVYDSNGGALVHTIELAEIEAANIGIGERALAYSGSDGAYLWCFDRTWTQCGVYEGFRGTAGPRSIAIDDVVWVGDPERDNPYEAGRVLGFQIP